MSRYSKEEEQRLQKLTKGFNEHPSISHTPESYIHELQDILNYHEWRYYVLSDPIIDDFRYDMLYKVLEKWEELHPKHVRSHSPTQRISSDLTDAFPKVKHLLPMLSLDNSYNMDDLNAFDLRLKRVLKLEEPLELPYAVEPKFDGGGIALVYENDMLFRAATRGNGNEGEEITQNAKVIRSIPLKAPFSKFGIRKAEVRGEVLIEKEIFKRLNTAREKAGLSSFANPRNAATGGLRMKDPKEVAQRGLTAFIYQIGYIENAEGEMPLSTLKSQFESLEILHELGFLIPKNEMELCRNISEVNDVAESWAAKREAYPYEIDGLVVKANSFEYQAQSGATAHHPRWAIAFKFKAKQAVTKLLDVEFQVGKIGSITPVAKLNPVQLAGVSVSSVSLHNEDFITQKDLRIGDDVLVERAGDVIPYIVKSISDVRNGKEQKVKFPSHCPSCQTKLNRTEGEAVWRCDNYFCQAQVVQRLIHHVSKDAMNIDGMGKAQIERFYKLGWIKNISDIYKLNYEEISKLEGFGAKSASNLEQAINFAKNNPIHRLIFGLSIHHVGIKVSKILASEIKEVHDLKNWTKEQLEEIDDIGPIVAQNVVEYFSKIENIELLSELKELGVNTFQLDSEKKKAPALREDHFIYRLAKRC